MNRVKLRNILWKGHIPLENACYGFLYMFILSLVLTALIFNNANSSQLYADLLLEQFAPNNIIQMYYFSVPLIAVVSVFRFPYRSYDSFFIKLLCITPANLFVSLTVAASAITLSTLISWLTFGQSNLPDGLSMGDVYNTTFTFLLGWPFVLFFLNALTLPQEYVKNNSLMNPSTMIKLIKGYLLFSIPMSMLHFYQQL